MTYVRIKIETLKTKDQRTFLFSGRAPAVAAMNNLALAGAFSTDVVDFLQKLNEDEASTGTVVSDNRRFTFDFAELLEELQSPIDLMDDADPIMHYVLMRKDVPDYLSGKAQAQANHAGTKMVIDGYKKKDKALTALLDEWEQEGGGFGTCIVLEVDAPTMRQSVSMAELLGIHTGIVHDPSYPLRDGDKLAFLPVDTCAYLFGRKSDCFPVVGKFPLLKDEYRQ